jgi:4-amino-4-deoxy-L-arabinose transferase-like glycosyltransferase
VSSRRWGFARQLVALGVAGLGVRLAYALYQRRHLRFPFSDATKYWAMANDLANGRWFVDPLSGKATADHAPLYSVYLSVAGLVRGSRATQFDLIVWTCILGTASVVLIGLAGREMISPRVGLLAAAVAAVDPAMWIHDGLLLSESMAIFTAVGLIWFSYRLWRSPSLSRVVWLGVWCGLGTLSRSELALSVPLLLLPLTLRATGIDWRRRVQWLVAGGIAAALVITPWIAFNRSRFEEPVYLTTNFGRTMAAAKCHGGYYGRFLGAQSYDCLRKIDRAKITPEMDESQTDRVYRAEAEDYVKAHPARTVVEVAASWGRIFGVYRPTQELSYAATAKTKGVVPAWMATLSFYVLFPIAIYGAFVLRRRRVPVYPLLAFWVMILFSITLTFAQQRYRAIGEPTLVLLTAVAIDQWIRGRTGPTNAGEPESTTVAS